MTGGSRSRKWPRSASGAAATALFSLLTFALIAATLLLASALSVGGPVGQAPAQAQSTQSGFRVYTIVLDGLEPQEVNSTLMPNLSELKSQGTWYEQARAVFPAETLPNHAAMMTGVLPERHGIISNQFWFEGTSWSEIRMQEPALLGTDTLTTRLENCCSISTATVLSKGYLWGLFRGEPLDPADGPALDQYGFPEQFNHDHPTNQRKADFHWKPIGQPGYIGNPDDHAIDQSTLNNGFLPWVRSNPPTPQFAFVNLGDIDRSGHVDESGAATSGGVSAFRASVIADTDTLVGQFVDELKSTGAWEETVLIFTSDHGMDWSHYDAGAGVQGVDVTATLRDAGYGDTTVVSGGGTAAVYAGQNDDIAGMATALSAHPGVAFVATPQSVPGLDNPTLHEVGMEHRFNGDIVVFVKQGWAVRDSSKFNPLPGNHGHPESQHSVLMVAGGHPVLDDSPESVSGDRVYNPDNRPFAPPAGGPGNVSVAPTVAALFGIGEPAGGYDGEPLSEAFEPYAFDPHTPGEPARPRPDVSIDKSDEPDPAKVGQALTYTLAVRNAGPTDATGVKVVDNLPATVKPGAISTSQGTCSRLDQRVTCNLGRVVAGGSATVTIAVRPQAKGTILNKSWVTLKQIDANESNNRDAETTSVR
jgi:uncharacterized repeat protein (TIGR01451 family)